MEIDVLVSYGNIDFIHFSLKKAECLVLQGNSLWDLKSLIFFLYYTMNIDYAINIKFDLCRNKMINGLILVREFLCWRGGFQKKVTFFFVYQRKLPMWFIVELFWFVLLETYYWPGLPTTTTRLTGRTIKG